MHTIKQRKFLSAVIVILALAFPSSMTLATTHYVPDDAPCIQPLLDRASSGDTIIVRDGVYRGSANKNLDFRGKAIKLRSESGPGACIIDCEGDGTGVQFRTGEGARTILDGFMIIRGSNSGIICESNTSPIIRNCIIAGNCAESGGGIYCGPHASPTITNLTITGNSARNGGGVFCDHSEISIANCILWDDNALLGPEIYLEDDSSATVSYSNVRGGQSPAYVDRFSRITWAAGNLDANPLFVDALNMDYHLQPYSPCIDAGDPSSDCLMEPEPNGAVINMGAFGNTAEATVAADLATDDDDDEDEDHHHHNETTCFFSSSAQDSPIMDNLNWLREFRDRYLMPNLPGKMFVEFYYWLSPPLARFVAKREPLRAVIQVALVPTIWTCRTLLESPKITLGLMAFIGVCVGSVLFMLTMVIARCARLRIPISFIINVLAFGKQTAGFIHRIWKTGA